LEEAIRASGSVGAALESLRRAGYCRLRPIEVKPLHPLAALIAAYHLGDPIGPGDAWRPWKRKAAAKAEAATVRRQLARHIPIDGGAPAAPPAKPAAASRSHAPV
jgi:hypothetical protein